MKSVKSKFAETGAYDQINRVGMSLFISNLTVKVLKNIIEEVYGSRIERNNNN